MKQVTIAIDQLVNTLLGGYADETISARVYRKRNDSWWWYYWHYIINAVFFWEKNHCYLSYVSELERRQLHHSYRSPQP